MPTKDSFGDDSDGEGGNDDNDNDEGVDAADGSRQTDLEESITDLEGGGDETEPGTDEVGDESGRDGGEGEMFTQALNAINDAATEALGGPDNISDDLTTFLNSVPEDAAGEFTNWQPYEHGDEKFIEPGDRVVYEREDQRGYGTVTTQNGLDGLLGIETPDDETVTVENWDIRAFQRQTDDIEALRTQLKEAAENAGIGTHSDALQEYTNDKRYRELDDQIETGRETARESPAYDMAPEMEIAGATLATTDEDTAQTIEQIQGQAKVPLGEEITVYRGITVDKTEFFDEAEQALEEGETVRDSGFQSATINPDVAAGFGNVVLRIQTDHGAYVRAASEHASEDEVLLPAGTEYEVRDIDRDAGTVAVTARGGYDLNSVDVDHLRELVIDEGMDYPEAVERVI